MFAAGRKFSSVNQLMRLGLLIVTMRVFAAFAMFVVVVVLARHMGPEAFGALTLALAVFTLAGIPVQSGLPLLLAREVAATDSNQQLATISWAFSLFIQFLPFIVLIVLAGYWAFDMSSNLGLAIFLALGAAFYALSVTALFLSAILRGYGYAISGALGEALVKPLTLLCGLVLLLLSKADPTSWLAPALFLYAFANLVPAVVNWLLLRRAAEVTLPPLRISRVRQPGLWVALLPMTVYGGVQGLHGYLDVLVMGVLLDDGQVGQFKAGMQLASVAVLGLAALNQMLQPKVSAQYRAQERTALQQTVAQGSLLTFVVTAFPALILIFFAELLVTKVFGPAYSEAASVVRLLSIAHLVNVAFGSVGMILNMTGHERLAMKGLLVSLVVNLVLTLILVPRFGIAGAGGAAIISTCVWNFILHRGVWARIGIESSGLIFYTKLLFRSKEPRF